jgi:2-dehydro-3-deoxygluconokinase
MLPRIVSFGEIMLRLSPPSHQRFAQASSLDVVYGGGEANVAVALAQLGHDSVYVTRLPAHEWGQAVAMHLRKYGVDTRHTVFGGEKLGLYFLENGAANRASKVIYDRANSAFSEIRPGMIDWEAILAGATWFHWCGITPAVSEGAAHVCLEAIQTANRLGITVSTDLNYRANLWKYGKKPVEVMPQLVEGCDLMLAGEDVAEIMLGLQAGTMQGSETPSPEKVAEFCQKLQQAYPRCRRVAVTLRQSVNASHNAVSAMLYAGERLYQAPTHDITHIVDRIGAGDAFMGALIHGLLTFQDDPQQALDFATAAYAYKHTIPGDALVASAEEIARLMRQENAGRVAR